MYSLAFDTTGRSCSIALMKGDKVQDCFEQKMDFGQSEVLIPQIDKLLSQNNLCFNNLDAVFVCVGPGSFTGVRASISAARVFNIASSSLKLGGVSAFDVYRYTFDNDCISEINAIIIETRRDDFYVQLLDKNLQKITNPQVMTYEELLNSLKEKGGKVSVVGDGVERFLNKPSGLCLHSIKMFDSVPINILAKVGMDMLKEKKLNFPKPLYLRAAEVSTPSNLK